MSHAPYAPAVPQRLMKSPPHCNGGVLHQVVPANLHIPVGAQRYVDQPMTAQLAHHVVQHSVARRHLVYALAVQAQRQRDLCLRGLSFQRCFAHGHGSFSPSLYHSRLCNADMTASV